MALFSTTYPDLAAIELLSGTGALVRTGTNTWAQRTITGTANQITVTDGNGVAGNPTLSLPSAVTLPGSLLVTTSLTVTTTLQVDGNATIGNAVGDTHTINGGTVTISGSQHATTTLAVANVDTTNSNSRGQLTVQGGSAIGRIVVQHTGSMVVGTSTANNVVIQIGGATNTATFSTTAVNLASGVSLQINSTQVVTSRRTGWTADTGTDKRTANATYSGTAEVSYTQATIQALMD